MVWNAVELISLTEARSHGIWEAALGKVCVWWRAVGERACLGILDAELWVVVRIWVANRHGEVFFRAFWRFYWIFAVFLRV